MHWFVTDSVKQQLDRGHAANMAVLADQRARYEASFADSPSSPGSRIMSVAGNQAEIKIRGVMTKNPDFLAHFFGGGNTTYTEIEAALSEAENNDEIESVVIDFDSGGGTVDGMFDVLAALEKFSKPKVARASGLCASAAYALAANCDSITATNKGVIIGSIGVVQTFFVSESRIEVTSTNAPKKRPDVTTAEGVKVVREELDALHDLYVEAVATGRGTTKDTVNAEFGQGATFVAGEALKRGMIDAIVGSPAVAKSTPTTTTSAVGGNKQEPGPMNLQDLQAQHPDVYKAAVDAGVNQERDRVKAHLLLGEESGAMDVAVSAVRDGSGLTAELNAQYVAAGINRRDAQNRADDDDAAAAAANAAAGGGAAGSEDDEAEQVVSLVEERLGITQE